MFLVTLVSILASMLLFHVFVSSLFEQIINVIDDIGFIWACNYNVSVGVGECGFVIVEVMVFSLIVLENVCGGAGGSDDQGLR